MNRCADALDNCIVHLNLKVFLELDMMRVSNFNFYCMHFEVMVGKNVPL